MGDRKFPDYPAWRYGPNGASQIFQSGEDVPAGWTEHPSKVDQGDAGQAPVVGGIGDPGTGSLVNPGLGSGGNGGNAEKARRASDGAQHGGSDRTATSMTDQFDAAGWPWDTNLHAGTKTKTDAGLWRMKVGVKRPDPKPGFLAKAPPPPPAQPLDL